MEKRLLYADALRAFSILAMLIFHSTGTYYYSKSNHDWWLIAGVIRSATSVCIPLFFMLSGMLLLDSRKANESISTFFHKRCMKVAVPTAAWSVFYFSYKKIIKGTAFTGTELIKEILSGPVYSHLWFMYALIGLYLATPILRIYTCHGNRGNFGYFIFMWVAAVGILPILQDFFGIRIGIQVAVTTGWIGYFIAGYYLKDTILSKNQIIYAIIIFIACLLSTVYLVELFTFTGPSNFSEYFIKFRAINIIIMSFITFMITRSIDYDKIYQSYPFAMNCIKYLSSTSFGIYLIHYVILENLRDGSLGFKIHEIGGTAYHPLIGIFITFLATLSISLIAVSILRKTPCLKAMVP